MAGVTDLPFRRLAREFAEEPLAGPGWTGMPLAAAQPGVDAPAGLYVMEMVTAKALTEGNRETWRMIEPDPAERVRSVQLYGTNPAVMAAATRALVERGYADHIDMNFGCPVPKVTRRGGGAALPWKRDLFQEIVRSVVRAADQYGAGGPGAVPVTVKMRIGIDDDHVTVFDAARIAQQEGIAGVGLHARTQEQHYAGQARWDSIARLKDQMRVPVFGNGDVFSGHDALRMMQQTGCDAVVVGRGCQGRPWLFREIVAQMHGLPSRGDPGMAELSRIIQRHAALMVEAHGDELRAMREMRKHVGWYLRGFAVGGAHRQKLGLVGSRVELAELLSELDQTQPYPAAAAGPRGRAGRPKRPHLPDGWLDSREVSAAERALLHLADDDGGSGG